MTHATNKVDWCLKKAEKELKEGGKHRGLVKKKPSNEKAMEYLAKANHYLEATDFLKKNGYSDISASTSFYAIYHCLLAVAMKNGYESRNQECTFALIKALSEEGKAPFDSDFMDKLSLLNGKDDSLIELRERYQYGTEISMEDSLYASMRSLAKDSLDKTKVFLEV